MRPAVGSEMHAEVTGTISGHMVQVDDSLVSLFASPSFLLLSPHLLSPLPCFWLTSPPSLLSSSPGECPSYHCPITHTHTHTLHRPHHTQAQAHSITQITDTKAHTHTHTCTFTRSTCHRPQTHTRTHHTDHLVCTRYMP